MRNKTWVCIATKYFMNADCIDDQPAIYDRRLPFCDVEL